MGFSSIFRQYFLFFLSLERFDRSVDLCCPDLLAIILLTGKGFQIDASSVVLLANQIANSKNQPIKDQAQSNNLRTDLSSNLHSIYMLEGKEQSL